MPHDHTPLTGEIATAAATADGPAEPSLTLTQLNTLLREATAYAQAQRPIVIYQPAPAPAVAVQPAASLAPAPTGPGPTAVPVSPVRRGWGVALVYASLAALLTGAADGVLTGTAPLPVLLCAAGILGTIGGTARALTEEARVRP